MTKAIAQTIRRELPESRSIDAFALTIAADLPHLAALFGYTGPKVADTVENATLPIGSVIHDGNTCVLKRIPPMDVWDQADSWWSYSPKIQSGATVLLHGGATVLHRAKQADDAPALSTTTAQATTTPPRHSISPVRSAAAVTTAAPRPTRRARPA